MLIILSTAIVIQSCIIGTHGINCTTNVCKWYSWAPWAPCSPQGHQNQTRLACCPDSLKENEKTIEKCVEVCERIHPGQLNLTDAFRSRSCTPPTTTTTTTTTGESHETRFFCNRNQIEFFCHHKLHVFCLTVICYANLFQLTFFMSENWILLFKIFGGQQQFLMIKT